MKIRLDETLLQSYEQIASYRGFYLNVATGDLYKNNGQLDKATRKLLHEHDFGKPIFARITEDLSLSVLQVKNLACKIYGVAMDELGKVVDNDNE